MHTDIIVLNNAETAIYNELRRLREQWQELAVRLEQHPEDEYNYGAICGILERNYKTCRRFVADAWGVDTETIEDIIHGKYRVIAEESLPIYNA